MTSDHHPEHLDATRQIIDAYTEEEMTYMTTSPMSVHVDVCELLDMFEKDEARLWEFLGKLKDLFA